MLRIQVAVIAWLAFAGYAAAQDEPPGEVDTAQAAAEPTASAPTEESSGDRTLSGMSILGNEEAPKALVIVPWKSSQIGDGLGVTDAMDDRARPVDKEVFLREVHYYQLRAGAPE